MFVKMAEVRANEARMGNWIKVRSCPLQKTNY